MINDVDMINNMYLKKGIAIIFLLFNFVGFAQKQDDSSFFFVENLTFKEFSSWYNSISEDERAAVLYSCVPAKIIEVKNEFVTQFKATTKQMSFQMKKIEITKKEAELKCADQRKL